MRNTNSPLDALILVIAIVAVALILLGGFINGSFHLIGGIALLADGFIIGNKLE